MLLQFLITCLVIWVIFAGFSLLAYRLANLFLKSEENFLDDLKVSVIISLVPTGWLMIQKGWEILK